MVAGRHSRISLHAIRRARDHTPPHARDVGDNSEIPAARCHDAEASRVSRPEAQMKHQVGYRQPRHNTQTSGHVAL